MLGLALLLGFALILLLTGMAAMLLRGISRPPRKTFAKALARGDPTDPAELGWRAEAVTVRLSDGQSSPGWVLAGDAPQGPAVVVLHGFGDSRYGALTWVELFKPHSSRILAYDQRGHGESQAALSFGGAPEAAVDRGHRRRALPVVDRAGGSHDALPGLSGSAHALVGRRVSLVGAGQGHVLRSLRRCRGDELSVVDSARHR